MIEATFSEHIRKQQPYLFGFGIALCLVGAGGLVLGAAVGSDDLRLLFGCSFIGLGLALAGARLLVWSKRPPSKHPAIVAVVETPSDVVWVYPVRHVNRAAGAHVASDLIVCTRRGKRLRLPCARLYEDKALEVLRKALPHAIFGYSNEVRERFRRDPTLGTRE